VRSVHEAAFGRPDEADLVDRLLTGGAVLVSLVEELRQQIVGHIVFSRTSPLVEQWSPDFSSSGLPNPIWTRVKFRGAELYNSLEWTEWNRNPVQVQICDTCGNARLPSGGYVHVSAVQDILLWTAPHNAHTANVELFPGG
jgi:hypothetical protein